MAAPACLVDVGHPVGHPDPAQHQPNSVKNVYPDTSGAEGRGAGTLMASTPRSTPWLRGTYSTVLLRNLCPIVCRVQDIVQHRRVVEAMLSERCAQIGPEFRRPCDTK